MLILLSSSVPDYSDAEMMIILTEMSANFGDLELLLFLAIRTNFKLNTNRPK